MLHASVMQGYSIGFPDMDSQEKTGKIYDFLVTTPSSEFEIECKTITGDAGLQIKSQLTIGLCESFRKSVGLGSPIEMSGLFTLQLHRPADSCKNLANRLRDALIAEDPLPDEQDFSITFTEKREWQNAFKAGHFGALKNKIMADANGDPYCAIKVGECVAAIVFKPHKPSTIPKNVIDVLKDSYGKFSGTRPSVIWLHFIGMSEMEFRELAEFSMSGSGGGLNAAVSIALHDRQGQPIGVQIERVRFSADSVQLTTSPALSPDLLLTNSVSLGGSFYDVPNPRCTFSPIENI